jgi:hypothetical protein
MPRPPTTKSPALSAERPPRTLQTHRQAGRQHPPALLAPAAPAVVASSALPVLPSRLRQTAARNPHQQPRLRSRSSAHPLQEDLGVLLVGRDGPGDGESEQSSVRPGVVAAAGAAQRAGCEHAHAHPGVQERSVVFLRAGSDGAAGVSGGREGDCGVWEEGGYSV